MKRYKLFGYLTAGVLVALQLALKPPEIPVLVSVGAVIAAFIGGMGFPSSLIMFWLATFKVLGKHLRGKKGLADALLLFADLTVIAYFAYKMVSIFRPKNPLFGLAGIIATIFFLYLMPVFREEREVGLLELIKLRILKGYYRIVRNAIKERQVEYVLLKARIDTLRKSVAFSPMTVAVMALMAYPLLPGVAVALLYAYILARADERWYDRACFAIALIAGAAYHLSYSTPSLVATGIADLVGAAIALWVFLDSSYLVRKAKKILAREGIL